MLRSQLVLGQHRLLENPGKYRNGGAGPDYGLHPLSKSVEEFQDLQLFVRERGRREPLLSLPFPFGTADAQSIIDKWRTSEEKYPSLKTDFEVDGAMEICHRGCDYYYYLVLSGSSRGWVWTHNGGYYPLQWYPSADESQRMGFFDWYEAWLNEWLAPGAIEAWAKRFRR